MKKMLHKAKRIDNGEWVEGYYVCINQTYHCIYTGYGEVDCGGCYPDFYEINPDTLCQYTGITDMNENKVWTSDIVKSDYDTKSDKYYKCVWDELRCAFVFIHGEEKEEAIHFLDGEYRIRVVGNSFDNPELRISDWVGRQFKCVYGLDHGNIITVTSEPYCIRGERTVDTISVDGEEEAIEIRELYSMYFEEITN